ncbi:MAG: AtpZ/AtpI family protein [Alphaproteobacteria bacterium]
MTTPDPSLEDRLKAARQRQHQREHGSSNPVVNKIAGKQMGIGMRIGTEMIGAILFGVLLGFGADALFDSKPFGLIICLFLAFGAGLRNIWRQLKRLEEANKQAETTKDNSDTADQPDRITDEPNTRG